MKIQITNLHKQDAWYPLRNDIIGLQGTLMGRITDMGGWYNLTMETDLGEEITFAYCKFERMTP